MTPLTALVAFIATALLCTLPRRLAAIPLLAGAAYVTRDAVLEIAGLHFTVLHIMVLFGMGRVLWRGERLANGWNAVDWLLILWAVTLVATSPFHQSGTWAFRASIVWNDLGCYLLLRCLIQDPEDVRQIFKALCVILVPIAVLMLAEKSLGQNFFAALGGTKEVVIRGGQVRARGAFFHPILAGTVGATCLPMALYLWKGHRWYALSGVFAALGIVYASTSSGPVMMAAFILMGLMLWKVREHLRAIHWVGVTGILVLNSFMSKPLYFLMEQMDATGTSTGGYRAQLIQAAIDHFDEWWLVGTDYTRHWMPTGIPGDEAASDIVNQLLAMGVKGGLVLMLLYILAFMVSFRAVGRMIRKPAPPGYHFLPWVLGAALFGQVMNFFSIALFDQSSIFYYLLLAAIGAVCHRHRQDLLDAAVWLLWRRIGSPGAGGPRAAVALAWIRRMIERRLASRLPRQRSRSLPTT